MTVLHEHPAPVAELQGDGHAAVGVQPVHVFAPPFPRGHVRRAAVTREDLPLFEMDMNRVVPSASVVDQGPYFARAESRRGGNPTVVRVQGLSTVGRDSPGPAERGNRGALLLRIVSEHESARSRDRNCAEVGIWNQRGRHLADVRIRRVAHDDELEESSDARIARCAGKRLGHCQIG